MWQEGKGMSPSLGCVAAETSPNTLMTCSPLSGMEGHAAGFSIEASLDRN